MKFDLTDAFNRVQRALPDFARGITPLGTGQYGLIADRQNGTVSKILFRHSDPHQQAYAERMLANELTVLQKLDGEPIGSVRVPELIDQKQLPDNPEIFATYTMTRLTGHTASWHDPNGQVSAKSRERHFRQLGEMLALFHDAARQFNDVSSLFHTPYGGTINLLEEGEEDINKALETANRYLQTHKRSMVIHGDIHHENILVDHDHNIAGLFDFARTGPMENHLVEFNNVPGPALHHVIKGYEDAGGEQIDLNVMTMTFITRAVDILNWESQNPEDKEKASQDLYRYLNDIRHITGLTPPALP